MLSLLFGIGDSVCDFFIFLLTNFSKNKYYQVIAVFVLKKNNFPKVSICKSISATDLVRLNEIYHLLYLYIRFLGNVGDTCIMLQSLYVSPCNVGP